MYFRKGAEAMKTLVRILIPVGVLGLGVAAVVLYSGARETASAGPPPDRVGYTITWHATVRSDDGKTIEAFTQTRYVSTEDAWRNVKTFPNGSTQESFASQGQGVFLVDDDEKALVRLGPYHRSPNPQSIRNSKKYLRTEQVLGYDAYVLREEGPGITAEVYYAPALNGDVIKQVVSKPGSAMTSEPVSISLGEPAAETLQHKSYPVVKTAHFNNGVRSGQYKVKNSNRRQ